MRRPRTLFVTAAVAVAATLALAGCSAPASQPSSQPPQAYDGKPVTITFWHPFTADHDVNAMNAVLEMFHKAHPNITVRAVKAQDSDKVTQAISAGTAPDVALAFDANKVGKWCSTGAFTDLTPQLKAGGVDTSQFPASVLAYTGFQGKQCTLPLLADTFGLYYNKTLLAQAGYSAPPKTMSELTAMAEKLTVRDPGGTIKVAGFMPYLGVYQAVGEHFLPGFGGKWLAPDGTSHLASDPGVSAMLTWQKSLVDWFGAKNLEKFKAGLGDEFSAQNAFETGKIAMIVDGEWRNALIASDGAKMDWGTAPVPAADDHPELYGAGFVGGNVIGLPRGGKNQAAAFELVKYLTTDTQALAAFADVPTTKAALSSPDLKLAADPHFAPFLQVFANPATTTTPSSTDGGAYLTNFGQFALRWQQGEVSDLKKGLADLDTQNNAALKLGTP